MASSPDSPPRPAPTPVPVPDAAEAAPRIVGLGASAGGLASLELFFSSVPANSDLAYIVVQHLDPTRKTLLGSLLQRVTALPVQEATHGMPIERNAVYVIPPNSELTVVKGHLHLSHSPHPRGLRLPIDALLSSLAREQGERAVGVVLSGMGADGTLGLQSLHTQGGLTLAQQPESAQFDAMPRSAIAAGCVDIVVPPDEMPRRILQWVRSHQAAPASGPHPPVREDVAAVLDTILGLLRAHCRHDLSLYKTSTLLRRIERRVAVHNLASMSAYAELLAGSPQECDLLFAEMLIGVTRFFRDPEVWRDLAEQILPEMLARPPQPEPLRAWIAGCSTGEEAYSLAMLFKEVQAATPSAGAHRLQIFATDLNAEAVDVGRRGRYPASIAADVGPERLARFFTPNAGGFVISKEIRDMVMFAQHDVILDPPFTRLDLLACRNVLIYFNAVLQHRLMPLFHYSLRPGGVLLLGGAETVGRSQRLFKSLSSKTRLYRRNEHAANPVYVDFPIKHLAAAPKAAATTTVTPASTPPSNLQSLADQFLLQTHSPPAVLVNEAGDILYISGRTGRYLEPAAGKANWNVHAMARPGIRTQLAVALRQAVQTHATVELTGLKVEEDDQRTLCMTVQPVQAPRALEGMVMIVFKEGPALPRSRARKGTALSVAESNLIDERNRAHEEIMALREEMQASQDALQAANEALQSTNEELQSANEELTTSKEEAQSMNEELQTINGELQTKLDDLAMAQSDMQNLLNSTNIATLFLDNELNVRRFTEQTTSIFHLREGDIGRPLSDLASTLNYPTLHADAQDTLRTLATSEKQIPTQDGRWLSVRIMPYRTLTNMIQGAVITFVDITAAKELESRLRKG